MIDRQDLEKLTQSLGITFKYNKVEEFANGKILLRAGFLRDLVNMYDQWQVVEQAFHSRPQATVAITHPNKTPILWKELKKL